MARRPKHAEVRFYRSPELPGVEMRDSRYANEDFRPHTHRTYSVGVIDEGWTDFILGERRRRTSAGDIMAVPPGQVHACGLAPGVDIAYRLFYLDADLVEALAPRGPARLEFESPTFADPGLFARLDALARRMAGGRAGKDGDARAALDGIIADLAEKHGRWADRDGETDARRGKFIEALGTAADDRIGKVPLDAMAAAAGMSPCHFLRSFKRAFGLTPAAYRNQMRVEDARALLAEGRDAAGVAVDLGFADQSHFTRIFRRYTGATPGQYAAEIRGSDRR